MDFIPLGELPKGVPVATNGGPYAESMAEHALAMTLAAAKRLILEHENLKRDQFNRPAAGRQSVGTLRFLHPVSYISPNSMRWAVPKRCATPACS